MLRRIENAEINSMPIADYGAQKVLGVGGSLVGYIETGNAYDRRYYHKAPCRDTFVRRHPKRKTIDNVITGVIAAGAIASGVFLFVKCKKTDFKFPDLFKNFKMSEAIKKFKITEFLENIKGKLTNLAKISPKEYLGKIFKRAAKAETVQDAVETVTDAATEAVRSSSRIDKFNQRLMKADLGYIEGRANSASTDASKKALSEHLSAMRNLISDQ